MKETKTEKDKFDMEKFMAAKPHINIPENAKGRDIISYVGQLRKARKILLDLGYPHETVAYMSDGEVAETLFDCLDFIPVCGFNEGRIDEESIYLIPKEILKRCLYLNR